VERKFILEEAPTISTAAEKDEYQEDNAAAIIVPTTVSSS
jgi:hypothetical protein